VLLPDLPAVQRVETVVGLNRLENLGELDGVRFPIAAGDPARPYRYERSQQLL
jgi:hypothetical protein